MLPESTSMVNENPLNLKDCPFCGGDYVRVIYQRGMKRVECQRCFASSRECDSEENAVKYWQERPQ